MTTVYSEICYCVKLYILVETVTLTVFHKHNFIVNYDNAYSLNFLKMNYMYTDTWQYHVLYTVWHCIFVPFYFYPLTPSDCSVSS